MPKRALLTVVFSDICGSTEEVAAIGDDAWAAVLAKHDELVERRVGSFGGRVVKNLGDGALVAFDGASNAVRGALAIIDEVASLGLHLRVGVHCGELLVQDNGDLQGIAVHVASRICDLAHAGEVLVSHAVVEVTEGAGLKFERRRLGVFRHDAAGYGWERWGSAVAITSSGGCAPALTGNLTRDFLPAPGYAAHAIPGSGESVRRALVE